MKLLFSLLMGMQISTPNTLSVSSIDQGPYVNVTEDGMVAASNNEPPTDNVEEIHVIQDMHNDSHDRVPEEKVNKQDELVTHTKSGDSSCITQTASAHNAVPLDVITPFKRCLGQLTRQSRWSIWLLVYIAITTSWPLVGSALYAVFGKKLRGILPGGLVRR